jgi:hypothetical protein
MYVMLGRYGVEGPGGRLCSYVVWLVLLFVGMM